MPTIRSLRVRMYDGWWMPRYGWHLGRALISCALAFLLWRVLLEPIASALVAAGLTGVLPHVLGLLRRQYPFDVADWIADAVIALAPLPLAFVVLWGALGALMLVPYAVLYWATYPYASP